MRRDDSVRILDICPVHTTRQFRTPTDDFIFYVAAFGFYFVFDKKKWVNNF